ncbi:hypothetical protein SDC9_117491 [bioreactor metagenome]|uniref:Uncharacterized protein n=1 Tax=bioreactor metagenome TaxID=1076179 RepID=A0A645BYD1_9ZZZZ
MKHREVANFSHHRHGRKKAGALNRFKQMDLLDKELIGMSVNQFMHSVEHAIYFRIIFLDEGNIELDEPPIAGKGMAKDKGRLGGSDDFPIFPLGVGQPKTCSG